MTKQPKNMHKVTQKGTNRQYLKMQTGALAE